MGWYRNAAKLIKQEKEDVDNFIGDMVYLILKISYLCNVDSKKAVEDVLVEYEKRFPVDKAKGSHGNKLAGGIDLKQWAKRKPFKPCF